MPDLNLPATTRRVARHTPQHLDRRIRRDMENRVQFYSRHPDRVEDRIEELDREWDMERLLETNASALALLGLGLSLLDRRFLVLPFVVLGFLLQHGLQGWCPPVPLFRRLGVRTQSEIEAERYALKAVRGDFGTGNPAPSRGRRADAALGAVEM